MSCSIEQQQQQQEKQRRWRNWFNYSLSSLFFHSIPSLCTSRPRRKPLSISSLIFINPMIENNDDFQINDDQDYPQKRFKRAS